MRRGRSAPLTALTIITLRLIEANLTTESATSENKLESILNHTAGVGVVLYLPEITVGKII